jgi:hypothetical protein
MLLTLAFVLATAKPVKPTPPAAAAAPVVAPVVCPEIAPPPPAKPATVRVMLPDLEVKGRHEPIRAALGQIVAQTAGTVRGFEILSAAEVRAVMDQEANKQFVGCTATSCLAEIAEALDADLVVAGRIEDTPDGAALLSLSLVNARAIVVVNRVNVVWRGDPSRLSDVVRTSAQLLLVDAEQRKPGSIVLTGVVPEGRVVVDGVERTSDHLHGGVRGLDVGVHELTVTAPDKVTLTTWAIVESEKETSVAVPLDDVAVPSLWYWVGGATAVVAGVVGTSALLYLSGQGEVTLAAASPGFSVNDVESLKGIK